MHGVDFIQDLAIVMLVAGLTTILCHRFKQPVVLGYMLAGIIIGPYTPPFELVDDKETIGIMANLGITFLMFNLGLHFSIRKLGEFGWTALVTTVLEVLGMFMIGYALGEGLGWNQIDSIFLGAIISISSTTIIVKALQDMKRTKERFAHLIFGILIVEDIIAIALIALLSGIATTGMLKAGEVVFTFGRLGIFLTGLLVFGLLLVPRLLRYVARFQSNEMLLITALGLCFGVTFMTVQFGYSEALGAFMIGAIIAEAREGGKIAILVGPVKDLFSAVFFVSIGMMFDPDALANYWTSILAVTAALVIGKVLAVSFGAFAAGNDMRTSMRVGMGLAQIGEFSFIIAALGAALDVTGEFLYPIAVTVSGITTLLTPFLIRSSDSLVLWFDRAAPAPLVNGLEYYTRWVQRVFKRKAASPAGAILRRTAGQAMLNVVLITSVFLVADFASDHAHHWWPALIPWMGDPDPIFWLGAMIASMPMFIAAVRKLRALGMMIAETSAAGRPDAQALQGMLQRTLPLVGVILLSFWVLLISAALLPSWQMLVILSLVIAAVGILLWRVFIKLYAKAQVSLIETLREPPEIVEEHPVALPGLFREAVLELLEIHPNASAAGKFIRELELRSRTGVTVVGIERPGGSVLNPGPDDELRPGDRALLLGTHENLAAARDFLLRGVLPAARK